MRLCHEVRPALVLMDIQEAGANEYLSKPVRLRQVLEVMRRFEARA